MDVLCMCCNGVCLCSLWLETHKHAVRSYAAPKHTRDAREELVLLTATRRASCDLLRSDLPSP